MDLTARMDIILKNYNHLGKMEMAFKELQTPYINDLSAFGAQSSQMSFHPEDTTGSRPDFRMTFPVHEFDLLFDKVEKPEWNKPALKFKGKFYEVHGLTEWFSRYLGSSRYELRLAASSKWTKQAL